MKYEISLKVKGQILGMRLSELLILKTHLEKINYLNEAKVKVLLSFVEEVIDERVEKMIDQIEIF